MTPVEALTKARQAITGYGRWCQRTMHGGGSHCADGALRLACMSDVAAYNEARWLLGAQIGGVVTIEGLWDWNDDDTRNQTQVLDAFDRAIAAAQPVQPVTEG